MSQVRRDLQKPSALVRQQRPGGRRRQTRDCTHLARSEFNTSFSFRVDFVIPIETYPITPSHFTIGFSPTVNSCSIFKIGRIFLPGEPSAVFAKLGTKVPRWSRDDFRCFGECRIAAHQSRHLMGCRQDDQSVLLEAQQ